MPRAMRRLDAVQRMAYKGLRGTAVVDSKYKYART